MNCVQPIAPALDGPMLQPCPDSISVIPARTVQRMPNALPAAFHVDRSCAGPWQRGTAFRPVRTDGTPCRRRLELRASRVHVLPPSGRVGALTGAAGRGAAGVAGLRTL